MNRWLPRASVNRIAEVLSAGSLYLVQPAKRRKLWLTAHRYIGLIAGALLILIGLTGSILVFWQEIDAWLNPELFTVHTPMEGRAAYRPLSEILAAAKAAIPAEARLGFVYYPYNDAVAYQLYVHVPSTPGAKTPIEFAQHHVFVNPYTAEVTGSRFVRPAGLGGAVPRTFIGFVFALHYALLLPRAGDPPFGDTVVAMIGMILLFSLLSGLYLWWPKNGQWLRAFTIKRDAHVRRLNFDLHKTFGLYFSLVLLAVFLSGVYLNLPQPFVWVVEFFSPVTQVRNVKSVTLQEGRQPIGIDEAWAVSEQRYPEGQLYSFASPKDIAGVYVFTKHVPLGWGFWGRRQIAIDQYSGQVLHVADPLAGSAGDVFVQWQWPLHSGLAFGLPGRWIVFASGLVCPILFGTGFYLWWRKRKAWRRAK